MTARKHDVFCFFLTERPPHTLHHSRWVPDPVVHPRALPFVSLYPHHSTATHRQHSKTGEWSYGGVGGSLVSPVTTITPSPIGYTGAMFTPSPVFAPPPPPPPAEKKPKDDDKKKGKGWWETMYDDDGDRYWEHTVTKKTTYKDPYF